MQVARVGSLNQSLILKFVKLKLGLVSMCSITFELTTGLIKIITNDQLQTWPMLLAFYR